MGQTITTLRNSVSCLGHDEVDVGTMPASSTMTSATKPSPHQHQTFTQLHIGSNVESNEQMTHDDMVS